MLIKNERANETRGEQRRQRWTNQRTLFLVGISVHLIVISFVCLPFIRNYSLSSVSSVSVGWSQKYNASLLQRRRRYFRKYFPNEQRWQAQHSKPTTNYSNATEAKYVEYFGRSYMMNKQLQPQTKWVSKSARRSEWRENRKSERGWKRMRKKESKEEKNERKKAHESDTK